MTGRGTNRHQQVGTLASLWRNGPIGNIEPRPHFPDPSLVDDVAGVGNITSRVVTIDEVRTDMDHIFFVHIFDDIRLGKNDFALHTSGCTDVEVVGPMIVIGPLVFAKPVGCHLAANALRDSGIRFKKPEHTMSVVPVFLVNLFPLFETGLGP